MWCTAVIHLRRRPSTDERTEIERSLTFVRGLERVDILPTEALLTVRFDRDVSGLADIVRMIEDTGSPVVAVAQRYDRAALAS